MYLNRMNASTGSTFPTQRKEKLTARSSGIDRIRSACRATVELEDHERAPPRVAQYCGMVHPLRTTNQGCTDVRTVKSRPDGLWLCRRDVSCARDRTLRPRDGIRHCH